MRNFLLPHHWFIWALLIGIYGGACPIKARAADPAQAERPDFHGWRLLRTPSPAGGSDAISITHVADLARSSPELAGLMLRCDLGHVEALVVLITPLPPRAHPHVTIAAGDDAISLTADMVPPFTSIRLTSGATDAITRVWRARPELSLRAEYEESKVDGFILLAGLPAALQTLNAQCLSQ